LIPLIIRNNAIAVLPNYRLVPEHSGDDILADISDFWMWTRNALPEYISSKNSSVTLDLSRILVSGDSAGAWCALQSVFTQPKHTFKACLLQYPVLCAIKTSPDELCCGEPIPPKEVLEKELAAIVPGTIVSGVTPPARDWTAPMLRAYGRWAEFFGEGDYLWPLTRLDSAEYLVPTYIIHGKDDTNVPVEWSHKFVEKARKKFPEEKFEIVTPPGDHGFDVDLCEEDEEWLGEMMGKVREEWLT
jgi:acetyl esterase/lipase